MSGLLVVAYDGPLDGVLSTDASIDVQPEPETGRGSDGYTAATVAVWREACRPGCYRCVMGHDSGHDIVGAVVATVEVTGPSHHADECHETHSELLERPAWCTDEASSDGWHTPHGPVRWLSPPIPCDRPRRPELPEAGTRDVVDLVAALETSLRAARGDDVRPGAWPADPDLARRIREETGRG